MRLDGWRARGTLPLLVAVAIIAAVTVTVRQNLQQKARLAADECTILAMREAVAVYYRVHGTYPEHPGRYASCATLTSEQETALADVRRMVETTTRVYGVPPLSVVVGPYVRGMAASYRPGLLVIGPPTLTSPDRDAVIAHELAHHVLGHPPPSIHAQSALDDPREQERRELDANVKSVEILARVKRWDERTALQVVYDKLVREHRAFAAGRTVPAPGHRPPCEEIKDLLSRFPQHRAGTAQLECA